MANFHWLNFQRVLDMSIYVGVLPHPTVATRIGIPFLSSGIPNFTFHDCSVGNIPKVRGFGDEATSRNPNGSGGRSSLGRKKSWEKSFQKLKMAPRKVLNGMGPSSWKCSWFQYSSDIPSLDPFKQGNRGTIILKGRPFRCAFLFGTRRSWRQGGKDKRLFGIWTFQFHLNVYRLVIRNSLKEQLDIYIYHIYIHNFKTLRMVQKELVFKTLI